MNQNLHIDSRSIWLNKLLFSSLLLTEEIQLIDQKSTIVNYSKRETIVKRGEFSTHIFVLLEGFVKIEIDEGKKNLIVDIVSAPNVVGFPSFLGVEKHIFTITTLSDTVIMLIPTATIKEIIESNGRAALAAINYCNQKHVFPLLEKLQCLSLNNIRGRLARLLLNLSKVTHCSKNFTLLISRSEMAQMIGFSRENVIRMLSEFHSEGIIDIKGKSIEIVNVNRLEEMVKYG